MFDGTATISAREYETLIRCKIIVDDIFYQCGKYSLDGEAQFYLDDELLEKVFPERCAEEKARVREQFERLGVNLNV